MSRKAHAPHPDGLLRLEPLRRAALSDRLLAPRTLEIQPTDSCSHRCPWCIYTREPNALPLGLVEQLLADARRLGTRTLVVSGGGEPLEHLHAVEILETAARYGLATCLLTNGGELATYAETVRHCCAYVRVSLDAGTDATYRAIHGDVSGRLGGILAGIAAVTSCGSGPLVGGSMVVTRRNRAEIETLARRLAGCGAEYLLVKYDVRRSFEWNRKLRAEIAPQVEAARRWVSVEDRQPDDPAPAPIPLGLASLKGTVMADGCLYPCCHLCEPRHRIADLRETSLAAVWGSSRHYRVLERSRRGGHACRLFRYGAFLSTPATLKWSPNGAPERRVIFL